MRSLEETHSRTLQEAAMPSVRYIRPCLWFDTQAEEAAKLYVSVFKNSRITQITRYSEVGVEIHGRPPGSVMTVSFELDGHKFMALNGGPLFKFSEAISFEVGCGTQQEIDYYWEKLTAGGDPKAQQCGWLKDRFGVSWQIVPTVLEEYVADHTSAKAQRVMAAMLEMKKLDLAAIERAAAG
jgi:predicted 3-demethylubiquinone-9 3-methyltransferase (glyoxalase superfamily)